MVAGIHILALKGMGKSREDSSARSQEPKPVEAKLGKSYPWIDDEYLNYYGKSVAHEAKGANGIR